MIVQVKIVGSDTGNTLDKKQFFSDAYSAALHIQEHVGHNFGVDEINTRINALADAAAETFNVVGPSRTAKAKFLEL